jgi:hypothetical protein
MTIAPHIRPAWIVPKEEPEPIPYYREVMWWELAPVEVEVTDDDYRVGVFWEMKLEPIDARAGQGGSDE